MSINKIFYAELHDYELNKRLSQITKDLKIKSVVCQSPSFLLDNDQVEDDFKGKNKFMMAQFYQKQRKRFNILIDSNQKPIGGKWSFDAENRKRLPKNLKIPPISPIINKVKLTNELKHLINLNFSSNPGKIDNFNYAVSHEQAKISFDHFLIERFKYFGDYEDAISINEPYIFHSLLTPALNIGLITPKQILNSTLEYSKEFNVPLNSLEGFVRQIIGWREFIRGIYWSNMPHYKELNFFNNTNKLPSFFWDGNTKMHCIADVVDTTKKNAYAHHIQRLMVTGNFAMLSGISPNDICDWYLSVYIDAYEWVELPNTLGMATFSDGGVVGSKPYAASGKYINRMSNYCSSCEYNPKNTIEDDSCPFNYLYWNFLMKNQGLLSKNPRMGLIYNTLSKFQEPFKEKVKRKSDIFFKEIF